MKTKVFYTNYFYWYFDRSQVKIYYIHDNLWFYKIYIVNIMNFDSKPLIHYTIVHIVVYTVHIQQTQRIYIRGEFPGHRSIIPWKVGRAIRQRLVCWNELFCFQPLRWRLLWTDGLADKWPYTNSDRSSWRIDHEKYRVSCRKYSGFETLNWIRFDSETVVWPY